MTIPLLLSWLIGSAVCLSLPKVKEDFDDDVHDEVQEEVQDPAKLVSIAEHLRSEHLHISNYEPSVRS